MNYLVRDREGFLSQLWIYLGLKRAGLLFFKWKLALDDYIIIILLLGLPA